MFLASPATINTQGSNFYLERDKEGSSRQLFRDDGFALSEEKWREVIISEADFH